MNGSSTQPPFGTGQQPGYGGAQYPQQASGQMPVYGGQSARMTGYQPQPSGQMPVYGGQSGQIPVYQGQASGQMPVYGGQSGQMPTYQTQTGYDPGQGYQYPNTGYDAGQQPYPTSAQPLQEPPQEQPQPPQKPPRGKIRLNKPQIIVIVVVLAFTVGYLFMNARPARSTSALIESGALGARYTGSGLIVRDEVPYDADSVTSIEYITAEGQVAAQNAPICNVFSTGYTSKELSTLQDYRDQIRDYELKRIKEDTAYDARMDRVTADVLTRAKETRQIIGGARGNLVNQETLLAQAISTRQDYIRSKYATDQRLSRLLDDEHAQQQRIDSWTKSFLTSESCIISFYTDGLEHTLYLETASSFSPAEVRRMINSGKGTTAKSKTKTTIYRTIRDGDWMVLMLMDDTSWNPVQGESYTLQLERYENTTVAATVESFTRSGGELLVRLRVSASVMPVLYMRTASCVVGDSVPTLKVPARAIYTQDSMSGVVVVQNGTGVFVPVSVVYTEGSNVYIQPVTAGVLSVGMTVLLF